MKIKQKKIKTKSDKRVLMSITSLAIFTYKTIPPLAEAAQFSMEIHAREKVFYLYSCACYFYFYKT